MNKHLPAVWLPNCQMERIVLHWTGGTNKCTARDKTHYHFIIDGAGLVHRGVFSIRANARPFRAIPGTYAAHAWNFNASSIGVSLAGMGGHVTESPFRPGPYPIKPAQWQIAAEVVAQLCDFYSIPVTYETVLQHGEIEKRTGVKQRGKWDINKLPWHPDWTSDEVQRDFRLRVIKALATQ